MFENSLLKETHSIREAFKKRADPLKALRNRSANPKKVRGKFKLL